MSYQLQRDETLGNGLRRICRKQVELALAIATGNKETEDTPVHATRKHLKKARAALLLVRKEIGRSLFKRQDHCLRDIGRLISDIRDAEVRLQTVRQLQNISRRQKGRNYRKVEEVLMIEMENFIAAFAEWQSQAVPMLERMRDDIDHWPIEHFDRRQFCQSVQRTYKRGRNALADAKRNPTAECFHVFRTEAKQLWYQLRILRPVNPMVLKELTDELRSLGDLLGRAHDLSFLGERLRQESGRSAWQHEGHELLAIIETSQSDLQRGAADLAQRFYAERPRNLGAQISTWLDTWIVAESPSVATALMITDSDVVRTVPI